MQGSTTSQDDVREEREEIEKFLGYGEGLLKYSILEPLSKKFSRIYLGFCCFIYVPLQVVDLFMHDNVIPGADIYSGIDFRDLTRRLCVIVVEGLGGCVVMLWLRKKDEILKHTYSLQRQIRVLKTDTIINYENLLKTASTDIKWIRLLYSACGWALAITAALGSFLVLIFKNENFTVTITNNFNETIHLYTQQLPFYCWIPFNYRKTKFSFTITMCLITIPNATFITAILGTDIIFMGLSNLIRFHFDILKVAFKTTSRRCKEKLGIINNKQSRLTYETDICELNLKMEKEIKSLAIYYNNILQYCNRIGNYVNNIILAEISLSTISLGILLYTIQDPSDVSIEILATQLVFSFSWTVRLFFFCYCGQAVVADDLHQSILETDWLTTTQFYKSSMMIILIRMRNTFYFKLSKFKPLNFATFVQILKTAYSFFAVLRTRNS